jgi:hypothetical protein
MEKANHRGLTFSGGKWYGTSSIITIESLDKCQEKNGTRVRITGKPGPFGFSKIAKRNIDGGVTLQSG